MSTRHAPRHHARHTGRHHAHPHHVHHHAAHHKGHKLSATQRAALTKAAKARGVLVKHLLAEYKAGQIK